MRKTSILAIFLLAASSDAAGGSPLKLPRQEAAKNVAVRGGAPPPSYTNTHAFSPDGTNERADCADVAVAQQMSWTFWVRNPVWASEENVMSQLAASGTFSWDIRLTGSRALHLYTSSDGTAVAQWTGATNSMSADAWDHVLIRYDGSQSTNATRLRTWVNGTEITAGGSFSGTVPASLFDSTERVRIGVRASETTDFLNGSVDELGIAVGTLLDVASLYSSGHPAAQLSTVSGMTHCWDVNGETSPTITDDCGAATCTMENCESDDIQGSDIPT